MIGKLDTQEPRVLAQLHGAEEPIRRSCGVSCSIHLPVSPLRPITTWTKGDCWKTTAAFVPAHSIFPAFHAGAASTISVLSWHTAERWREHPGWSVRGVDRKQWTGVIVIASKSIF